MKTPNAKHQTFIIEMIRHGDKIRAYQSGYPTAKGEACRKAADRLLLDPDIAAPINEAVDRIRREAIWEAAQERKEEIKQKILTIEMKREALAKIVMGETRTARHVKLKDDYVVVYDSPKPYEIIRAIETDSKLAADYWKEAAQEQDEDNKCEGFEIYIDGVPFDGPNDAPVNPNIPMGLVMIPKKGPFKAYLHAQEHLMKNPGLPADWQQNGTIIVNLPADKACPKYTFNGFPVADHLYQADYPDVPDYQNLPSVNKTVLIEPRDVSRRKAG